MQQAREFRALSRVVAAAVPAMPPASGRLRLSGLDTINRGIKTNPQFSTTDKPKTEGRRV